MSEHLADILAAAEMLDREEVRYSLGLDFDHIQTEIVTIDGNRTIVTHRDEDEAEAEMIDLIVAHNELIQRLRDYVAVNR